MNGNITLQWIQPIVMLIIGGLISSVLTWFWITKRAKQDALTKAKELQDEVNQRLIDRIVQLETQHGLLSQTVLPLSTAFQAILVKELTHFHTPEMDALLAGLGPPYTLTHEQETRLAEMLLERIETLDGDISGSERDAALMLPYVMKRVRSETVSLEKLDLVIVPRDVLALRKDVLHADQKEEKEATENDKEEETRS